MPNDPKRYVVDIIMRLDDPRPLAVANMYLNLETTVAGKKVNPFIVNLRTIPTVDINTLRDFYYERVGKRQGAHMLRQYLYDERDNVVETTYLTREELELGKNILNHPNIRVNNDFDEKPEGSHTETDLGIVFARENGHTPHFIKKEFWKYAKPRTWEVGDMGRDMMTTEKDQDSGLAGSQQEPVNVIAYKHFILVFSPEDGSRTPPPQVMGQSNRMWVLNEEHLRELVAVCNDCGGQKQFLTCRDCGKQMWRLPTCPECGTPLKPDGSGWVCAVKNCKAKKPLLAKDIPADQFMWVCRGCSKKVADAVFGEQQRKMKCITRECGAEKEHPRLLFLGKNMQYLTPAVAMQEYKVAMGLVE